MPIKTEYIEFIKSRALTKDITAAQIKRELDEFFSRTHNDVPSIAAVEKYTAKFKAAAKGDTAVSKWSKNTIDKKYLIFIEKGVHEGKIASQIRNELWNKFGENSVCKRAITSWAALFKAVLEEANTSNNQQQNRESQLQQQQQPKKAVGSSTQKERKNGGRKVIEAKFRKFIENCVHEGKCLSEVEKELWDKHGKKSISKTSIKNWFQRFQAALADEAAKSSSTNHQSATVAIDSDFNALESDSNTDYAMSKEDQPQIKIEALEDGYRLDEINVLKESPPESLTSGLSHFESLSTKTNREIDPKSSIKHQRRFDHGLDLEKILGDVVIDEVRFFLVKWKNSIENSLVSFEEVQKRFPIAILNFYQNEYAKI